MGYMDVCGFEVSRIFGHVLHLYDVKSSHEVNEGQRLLLDQIRNLYWVFHVRNSGQEKLAHRENFSQGCGSSLCLMQG